MNIKRKSNRTARIGYFGVGFDRYWGQFEGLFNQLMAYHAELKEIIRRTTSKLSTSAW